MPERYAQAIGEMMNGDNGLLILCGPTGSGKTTTIYSILKSLDAVKNNILTAESPIEIFIDNISQTQIDEDGPYDYAMWTRGILRQAPDIVMIGTQSEIRQRRCARSLHSIIAQNGGHVVGKIGF
jgi:type II secretory ATPase GspE/PulE/Tfp pilus assembly ATPase PilB-like protein